MHPNINNTTFTPLRWFTFFIYGTLVIFTSFFQLYLQDIGMSQSEIGALMAIGPLISLLANPFWGFYSDRLQNVRFVLLIMMLGTLLMVQLVFHVHNYTIIYIVMTVFFFFQTPMLAQSNTLILSYIEGTPKKFGGFRLYGSLGWALTAVAAGPVIDRLGVSQIGTVFTVLLLIAIGIILLLPPQTKLPGGSATMNRYAMKKLLGNLYFVGFIVFGILVAIPNAMNSTFVSLYIVELGGTKSMVGWAVFASSIFEAALFLLFDRYLKRNISFMIGWLAIVSLLFTLRWFLMAEATSPWEIIAIQLLHAVTFGGYFYVGTQLTMMFVPKAFRSSGQAIYTMTWSGVSGVIAGFLGGWLFQNFGSEQMYLAGVALSFVGAIGFASMWLNVKRTQYRMEEEDEQY
ncbi:MFS transporter [Paenibacillus kyungheensis]|uniref:MFS transporter n=1 Tax=Paenibacillus kyungheensis TaxID=1452732 RepID=A0AAX3M0N2_9BACL|nr:MFS transporter [Paenibacillus kyungheensis]WCT55443.1 MFS transporter [Paenibacillus kyungheensis]